MIESGIVRSRCKTDHFLPFLPFPFFFFLPAGGHGWWMAVCHSCLNSGLMSRKVLSALSRLRLVYEQACERLKMTLTRMVKTTWVKK